MNWWSGLGLVVTTVAVLAVSASAQSADISYLDSKGKLRDDKGTIEGHTFRGLAFNKGRNAPTRLISADELVKVEYSRRPDGYDEAMALIAKGELRDGAEGLLGVLGELKSDRYAWARQECLFGAADAYYRGGDYDQYNALTAKLVAEVPETRFLPEIELRRADLLTAQGKFDEAVAAYDRISSEGATNGYAPSFLARAALGKVEALLAAKKVGEAETSLAAAKAKVSGDAGQARFRAMEARVALAKEDISGARSKFQALVEAGAKEFEKDAGVTRHPILLAAGANGLGDILFAEEKYPEAMLEYSKTFALFASDVSLQSEVAWAMWQFARCNSRLANATKEDEQRKVYADRHRRMRERVASEFPRTLGGQLALKEMGAR